MPVGLQDSSGIADPIQNKLSSSENAVTLLNIMNGNRSLPATERSDVILLDTLRCLHASQHTLILYIDWVINNFAGLQLFNPKEILFNLLHKACMLENQDLSVEYGEEIVKLKKNFDGENFNYLEKISTSYYISDISIGFGNDSFNTFLKNQGAYFRNQLFVNPGSLKQKSKNSALNINQDHNYEGTGNDTMRCNTVVASNLTSKTMVRSDTTMALPISAREINAIDNLTMQDDTPPSSMAIASVPGPKVQSPLHNPTI